MFNGYNETPLISYNEFDHEREKKQENTSKWCYGPDASVQLAQHHSNSRQSEFWSPKSNLIGIPSVVPIPSKCSCSGCFSSPENQSYQGDSTRHRPWLPRTYPVPLNSANESCKLPGYYQWDNVSLSSQGPCFSEGNALPTQYLQENGGKHPYYRSHQNSRLSEPNQPGVITSVKSSEFGKKDILLKQKDEVSVSSATPEMPFFGQNGTKQTMFCNPTHNTVRNLEKRIDNRNCSSDYCDPSEKYSTMDSCRYPTNVASCSLDHISRLPVVEPYIKAVPSNLNQNRVPSTGHRSLKETKPQSYINPSYGETRKIICSEANQTVNGNKDGRPVYSPALTKERVPSENFFQSGQIQNTSPQMAMDLKNGGVHIDYSYFSSNRDLSKSCANMPEVETQKFMFENNKYPDFFPRNNFSDVIKRNNQVPVLDNKKDYVINQTGQMNMSEQHYGNLPRSNHISNMSKYLDVGNSKNSCGVYYAKNFSGDKMSKPDKFEQLPGKPAVFQRSDDGIKNDNVNVHARLPRSALGFNDPRDPRFADRAENSFSYQNNTMAYKNYVRSEYSYQGYNAQGRYEYPHVAHGMSGFQRNDLNQRSFRTMSQKSPNYGSDQFLPHANNPFSFDSHCQQPANTEKNLSQQFCGAGKIHSPASLIQLDSPVSAQHSVDFRLDRPLESRKPNNIEAVRAEDINRHGSSKISPLRLLRKKKFVNQKNETVVESISNSNIPADSVPALDVRKFWSTWAEVEDENIPTEMVVLDCQNIDPEQAKIFHLFESDPSRTVHLENSGVVTLKGSSCDKDPGSQATNFNAESHGVHMSYDQVSMLNEPKSTYSIIEKQTCENKVGSIQQEDELPTRKSFEENSQVETLGTPDEKNDNSKTGKIESSVELPVESVNQNVVLLSPKNEDKPSKRLRSRASQENKDSSRNKKTNLEKKMEKTNRLDKWTEKKFDFLKRAEESKAAEILRHEEEKKKIFERRLSFQQGSVTNEVKRSPSNNKTPTAKEKLEIVNKEEKSPFTNPDLVTGEKEATNEVFKSLSPFDDNSVSNSSEDSKEDLPHLPTSEYRRNKFLDYSEKKLFTDDSFSTLENTKSLELGSNDENLGNEDTNAKVNEDYGLSKAHHVLPVAEMEEIKNEKIVKQECLPSNNWSQSSEKYLTEKLGNNIFHSPLDGSLIDGIKVKGESGLNSFVMEDILKKMSEINFQSPEVKVENMEKNDVVTTLKSDVVLEKAKKPTKRIRKSKKLENQQESDERTDKLTVENISGSKPTIKFSIQKSHDLKISFKVLNNSKKCERDEEAGEKEVEGKGISVNESESSTELITLRLKSVQRDGTNCDKTRKTAKKIPFSRNGTMLKNGRRQFRRKKIRGDVLSPLKTPVLKIKKNRYLLQKDKRDPLAENTDPEKGLNVSKKPCSDEYFTSDDFQVQETIDSAKIKLTFKRHRTNFETEYKIDNNVDEDDNNVEESEKDLERGGEFKFEEFGDDCSDISKTRVKKKSKKRKYQEIFDEAGNFKREEENAELERNVDSDIDCIPKETQLESLPEEESVNCTTLQDLFREDENYNFNTEKLESTPRNSPKVFSDLPITSSSFETRDDNTEEGEKRSLNFRDVKSVCSSGRELVKDIYEEKVNTEGENSIEDIISNFLVKSDFKVKVNNVGANRTVSDSHEVDVNLTRDGNSERKNECTNYCSTGNAECPGGDESFQEYSPDLTQIGDVMKNFTLPVGESEKEANVEEVNTEKTNKEISRDFVKTYSQESKNIFCFGNETDLESKKNDSRIRNTRENSFECKDIENNLNEINRREKTFEISDDNNNNKDDNVTQLICSGQKYEEGVEDEKSSESIDSSTNETIHSKNVKSSYEYEADKDKHVEKTYLIDSPLNYYCCNEKGEERSTEEIAGREKDSEVLSAGDKLCNWKSYSNNLISDVDLNDGASNSYELEGNSLFDQDDSFLTSDKNFNQEDIETLQSHDSLIAQKFSESSLTLVQLLDTSEKKNNSKLCGQFIEEEDSIASVELELSELDKSSKEKIERNANVSPKCNEKENAKKQLTYSNENGSDLFFDKVDELGIDERNECLNEQEKIPQSQDDGSGNTESSDLHLESMNQSGNNSRNDENINTNDLKLITLVESNTSCEGTIGESLRDVKDVMEVPDSKKENGFLATVVVTDKKSLSVVETICSNTGFKREQIRKSSLDTNENSIFDLFSGLGTTPEKNPSDTVGEKEEKFQTQVSENHSNNKNLEEGEIVDDDSTERIPTEVAFVEMTEKAKPVTEKTKSDFDLDSAECFCATTIASPGSKKTEPSVDIMGKNSKDLSGKHENENISFDAKIGNDDKIKNSCRFFLEETKFDNSKIIRRRHSLTAETLSKLKSTESEKDTELLTKLKLVKKVPPSAKRSKIVMTALNRNPYYFKSRSCPPSLTFFNRNECQLQIPVLDIPVENIPLPFGDPPPENCFNFDEYFKNLKIGNEIKFSEPERGADLDKPKEEKQPEKNRANSLISFVSSTVCKELVVEEQNFVSKKPFRLKENIFHLSSSSGNCQSPFMLSDLNSCRNPSPPLLGEKHQIPSAINPMESSVDDSKTGAIDLSSKITELSPKQIKKEYESITESEELGWSSLKANETWKIDELNEENVDSSIHSRSSVQLISEVHTVQISSYKSTTDSQGMYDDLTKSPVQEEANFQNDNKSQKSQSDFLQHEEITQEINKHNSDEISMAEEKYWNEDKQKTVEVCDKIHEKNKKANESEVSEDDINCTAGENKVEVCVKSSNLEADEIQDDHEKRDSIKLICEDVDMEEIELRDLASKTVDGIDVESLNVLGFENDDYIRNEFYECEGIPTSEDLQNGDQNEDDKVSDDDKFRNIMQNCLDNAKKFLNEGNLKLFSGSVDDLLELDCQMTGENEPEKSSSDSANHISRDVLLTSCEDTVTDDLGLSEKFQAEDLSIDFVPSFSSDGSSNLCPEILPVDNWPYLEEEVPLSPSKPKQDESDFLPFLENAPDEEKIPKSTEEAKDLSHGLNMTPPHVNNGSFYSKRKTVNKTKGNVDKPNRIKGRKMSFPGLENNRVNRFRRRSLLIEGKTFQTQSRVTVQRRKTLDSFTGNILSGSKSLDKDIPDFRNEMSKLKNEADEMDNLWPNRKSLKCRLSLEKLRGRGSERQEKSKNTLSTTQENGRENGVKEIQAVSREANSLKAEESTEKNNFVSGIEPTHVVSVERKSFPKHTTSSWQPTVMLSRISQKELKRIRENSNLETHLAEDRINSKRNSGVDFSKEGVILEYDLEGIEWQESSSRPTFKKKRPNSFSDGGDLSQNKSLRGFPEKPTLYLKPDSKNRVKHANGKIEGQNNAGYEKSSTAILDKHFLGSHKVEKSTKHNEKENHHKSDYKAHELQSVQDKIDSSVSNPISSRKHKKSRFRNLYSPKKSEPHSNLSTVAKDISLPAQNILPLDDPKLVEAERVLSEIFKDCDLSQEEALNIPQKNTKTFSLNEKNEGDDNVKKKSTLCKNETSRLFDKKAKNSSSIDTLKNTEDHHAKFSSKNGYRKHSNFSDVSEKTEKTEKESEIGHSQISNKHARDSLKHCRSESVHFRKGNKKEFHEKCRGKHDEKKGENCESRERHKSDSERLSRHEKKKEKHGGTKDCRKEGSRSNRHETTRERNDSLSTSKAMNKGKQAETKNFVRKNEEVESPNLSIVKEREKYKTRELSPEGTWECEVCGFNDASERIAHIKTHPFHCQSCHLAFKTESYFINHLTKKHKDIRNQHHCLLCELSFDTEEEYQRHLETREHRHLESVEKNTINTLFTLLTGQPCPVLGIVDMKPEWLPNQAGTVHFYHQATPLSLALQYLKMHHDLSSSSTVSSAHLN